MTNPTQDDQATRGPWRLELDSGEILDVGGAHADSFRPEEGCESVHLRMPAMRALDLAQVLRTYSRMMDLVGAAGAVSSTEDSLARALHDAGAAARENAGAASPAPRPSKVTDANRLIATTQLQKVQPWLSHTALVGVVDAAARWLDESKDDFALGLLQAVAGEQVGSHAWLVLLGQGRPASSTLETTSRSER